MEIKMEVKILPFNTLQIAPNVSVKETIPKVEQRAPVTYRPPQTTSTHRLELRYDTEIVSEPLTSLNTIVR
jgi:hypothetical protein